MEENKPEEESIKVEEVFVAGSREVFGENVISRMEECGWSVKHFSEIIEAAIWFYDAEDLAVYPQLVIAQLPGGAVLSEFLIKRRFPQTQILLWSDCDIFSEQTKRELLESCDCLLVGNIDSERLYSEIGKFLDD